jgi:hypothetical protein
MTNNLEYLKNDLYGYVIDFILGLRDNKSDSMYERILNKVNYYLDEAYKLGNFEYEKEIILGKRE